MLTFLVVFLALVLGLAVVAAVRRRADLAAERSAWRQLAAGDSAPGARFDQAMVRHLPVAARRYFRYAIADGTPLRTVAAITMRGELALGTREAPNYRPMRAEQLLAAPRGFVWRVRLDGRPRIDGSDAAFDGSSWSRFWLAGLIPVGRAGGTPDHARSAFGRYVAEAVFWTPAALLPANHVAWEGIDEETARVTVRFMDFEQSVTLSVEPDGRLRQVEFPRWSDANPQKRFRLQPFGGTLSAYREFAGYRLPTRVDAGNFFGTDDYFSFFRATVTTVRWPGCDDANED
mgnify:CR=1 FL=1